MQNYNVFKISESLGLQKLTIKYKVNLIIIN